MRNDAFQKILTILSFFMFLLSWTGGCGGGSKGGADQSADAISDGFGNVDVKDIQAARDGFDQVKRDDNNDSAQSTDGVEPSDSIIDGDQGDVIMDISGEEREKMTVDKLIGQFEIDNLYVVIGKLHNMIHKQGYEDVVLDFSNCVAAFPRSMLPLPVG